MAPLAPDDPASCMVIQTYGDSKNITTLSLPFSRFGRVKIGGRATLIRFPSPSHPDSLSVAVFSPVALTPEVKEIVSSMGTLRYIAALDMEHHLFVGDWHNSYPEARLIGPEGMREKKAQMSESAKQGKVGWVEFLNSERKTRVSGVGVREGGGEKEGYSVDEEFDEVFDRTIVPAHPNKEVLFNFRPEKTLITADFMFNLPATEQYSRSPEDPHSGLFTRIMTRINGTSGPQMWWQRRLLWYVFSAGDKKGYARSVKEIEGWDFERIVPCHGDVITSGGKGLFRSLFGWHLDLAQKTV